MANNYKQIKVETSTFKVAVALRAKLLKKRVAERQEQLKKRQGLPADRRTLTKVKKRLYKRRWRRMARRRMAGRGFRGEKFALRTASKKMPQERLEEMRAKIASTAYIDFAIDELAEGIVSNLEDAGK